MTENDSSQSETSGKSHAQQAPGGGSSRGPEFGTGGEPQVPVPPYNELRSENTGRGAEATAKAFDASHAPERAAEVQLPIGERIDDPDVLTAIRLAFVA